MQHPQTVHISPFRSIMRGGHAICIGHRQTRPRPELMQRPQAARVSFESGTMCRSQAVDIDRGQARPRPEVLQRTQEAAFAVESRPLRQAPVSTQMRCASAWAVSTMVWPCATQIPSRRGASEAAATAAQLAAYGLGAEIPLNPAAALVTDPAAWMAAPHIAAETPPTLPGSASKREPHPQEPPRDTERAVWLCVHVRRLLSARQRRGWSGHRRAT